MLTAPTVITAPVGDVLQLDTIKLFLRVDGDELDAEIQGYAAGVVADIEQMTGTRLIEQVVEIRADRFGDLQHLQVGPVISVSSITYEDIEGVAQTLSTDVYELFGAALDQGIRTRVGAAWPNVRAASSVITARLRVGYATFPPDLTLAVLLAIRARYDGAAVDLPMLTINHRIWG